MYEKSKALLSTVYNIANIRHLAGWNMSNHGILSDSYALKEDLSDLRGDSQGDSFHQLHRTFTANSNNRISQCLSRESGLAIHEIILSSVSLKSDSTGISEQ